MGTRGQMPEIASIQYCTEGVLASAEKQEKKIKLQCQGREKQNCHYLQIIKLCHRDSRILQTNYFN